MGLPLAEAERLCRHFVPFFFCETENSVTTSDFRKISGLEIKWRSLSPLKAVGNFTFHILEVLGFIFFSGPFHFFKLVSCYKPLAY
jgi:hypothetical protein